MKVAFFSFGTCEGCRYQVINELDKLLRLNGIEIVREPLLGLMTEEEFDVAVVEGAATSRDVEELKHVRSKAKYMIALGSCAILGGIATLGYKYGMQAEEYLERGYVNAAPISQIVKVDSFVRGCPARVEELIRVLEELATLSLLPKYERRFEYDKATELVLKDDFLKLDTGKCIVCGRCVELCSRIKVHALTQAFRGYRVLVTTPANIPFTEAGCIRCGLCSAYCPVGAIEYRSSVEEAVKIMREGGYIVAEPLALRQVADALSIPLESVPAMLRELGFSDVEVHDPMEKIDTSREGILPFSSAEERWIRKLYPQAANLLLEHPRLTAEKGGVVLTVCAARKEDYAPTITSHELVMLVRGMALPLDDLPLGERFEPVSIGVKVAKGPEQAQAAIEEYLKAPGGLLVVQLCPGGCEKGSGAPFSLLNVY